MNKSSIALGDLTVRFQTLVRKWRNIFHDSNHLWQMFLLFFLMLLLALSVATILAAQWAINVDATAIKAKREKDIFSLAELKTLVSYYEERAGRFEYLKKEAAEPPHLEHYYGPQTPMSAYDIASDDPPLEATTTSAEETVI